MVVNISQVLSGDWDYVRQDIAAVVDLAHDAGAEGESHLRELLSQGRAQDPPLPDLRRAEADWVKTSTGYGTGGATLDDLQLMRKHAPPHVQVKAAGGVRDLDTLLKVRDLGVSRCGASRTKECSTNAASGSAFRRSR